MSLEQELKIPKFRNAYARGIVNLYYTANWAANNENAFMKQWGITQKQYNILRILRRHNPTPIAQKELRSQMVDNMSDISRLLVRMKKKELIHTRPSKKDKRYADVTISDNGLELLGEIEQVPTEKWGIGIYNLNKTEIAMLNRLLDKIRKP